MLVFQKDHNLFDIIHCAPQFQATQLQHHSFHFALPKVIQELWERLEKVSIQYKTGSNSK